MIMAESHLSCIPKPLWSLGGPHVCSGSLLGDLRSGPITEATALLAYRGFSSCLVVIKCKSQGFEELKLVLRCYLIISKYSDEDLKGLKILRKPLTKISGAVTVICGIQLPDSNSQHSCEVMKMLPVVSC
ncbi:Leucine-Rich Repeat-Containing Protein 25 [Manis pentadactyla]|nr:Leucine-Rich Repeat-Containing Protein 25 [Manis pentadactyla]